MQLSEIQDWSRIVFTNDDHNFSSFLNTFFEKKQFSNGPVSLRCRKGCPSTTTSNKFKKCELKFSPLEGLYRTEWKGNQIYLHLER